MCDGGAGMDLLEIRTLLVQLPGLSLRWQGGVIHSIVVFQAVLVLGNPQNSLDNPQNSL